MRDTLDLVQLQKDRGLIDLRWRLLLQGTRIGFVGLMFFGLVFTFTLPKGDPSPIATAIIVVIGILALICGFASTLAATAPISWVLHWLLYRESFPLRYKIPPFHFDFRVHLFWIAASVATLLLMTVFPAALFFPFVMGIAAHYIFSYGINRALLISDYNRALHYAALGKYWLPMVWYYHWRYGEILVYADRLEDAQVYYSQMLRIIPRFPSLLSSVFVNLANVLTRSGRYSEAFPLLQDAIQLMPDSIYHLNLVEWYLDQNIELERCRDLLDLGYRYPTHQAYWLLLWAMTLNRIGENEYAENNLKEALQIVAKGLPSLINKARIHIIVAKIRKEQGDLVSARHNLMQALAIEAKGYVGRVAREELTKL